MSESFESISNREIIKIGDTEAIEILRQNPQSSEAKKWFDQIQQELDILRQDFETDAGREICARVSVQMDVRVAIVKFLAGYKDDAIESLQQLQFGEVSSDPTDRVKRALDLMLSTNEEGKNEQLNVLAQEIVDIFQKMK